MKTAKQIEKLNTIESYTSNVVGNAAEHIISMLIECGATADVELMRKHMVMMESIREFRHEVLKHKKR